MSIWETYTTLHDEVLALITTGHSARVTSELLSEKYGITITRNAIIGRMGRAKVSFPKDSNMPKVNKPPKPPPKRKLRPNAGLAGVPELRMKHIAGEKEYSGQPPDASWQCDINGLTNETCRWPLGAFKDQPPFMYCGAPNIFGKAYCRHHFRQSVDPARMERYDRRRSERV